MVVEQDGKMFLPTEHDLPQIMSRPGKIRPITVTAKVAERLIKGERLLISERT
jgi:hypothetical protein